MNTNISRETAAELLLKYNKNSFHIQHAVTVEAVMKYFAKSSALRTTPRSGE